VKVLIANRGEIAVRIIRACRELGLRTVAVYSDCDRTALHVRSADEAYPIGANEPSASYLCGDRIIDTARNAGADAIHPGYGFLAENAAFARGCQDAGLVFVGPAADVIALMGSKTEARAAARRAGVPVVPGSETPLDVSLDDDRIARLAESVGYPLLVKAVAGGGGKGMRSVAAPADLAGAIRAARSEAGSAFGDTAIYFERLLSTPRHIEVQLLGDHAGTVVPFVERECSIQRRHQKLIEESPSPVISPETRRRLTAAAAQVARAVGYTNAGTIEFLLDADGQFYFLEMNTRLQVEHPITEMVTGIDLVHWQIRVARGERIRMDADRMLAPAGHAMECRIYAEDPERGFMPSPGLIRTLRPAGGPGVRDDRGFDAGSTVPVFYDSLISKLSVWGTDRSQALARMQRALGEYEITGIETTIPFFRWLLDRPDFVAGEFDTTTVDRLLAGSGGLSFGHESQKAAEDLAAIAAAVHVLRRNQAAAAPDGASDDLGAQSEWRRAARLEGLRDAYARY
jgi:acetyl-CoA carboxylase biotin carboxylase subunit